MAQAVMLQGRRDDKVGKSGGGWSSWKGNVIAAILVAKDMPG